MKRTDTERLVRYESGDHFNQRQIAAVRRRVLWLWTGMVAWLLVLTWLMHRFGAL